MTCRAVTEGKGSATSYTITETLLLNPDTVVTEDAIERLWQVLAAQPAIGVAGAQLLNADGSLQLSAGVFPSVWSELPLINRRPARRPYTRWTGSPARR